MSDIAWLFSAQAVAAISASFTVGFFGGMIVGSFGTWHAERKWRKRWERMRMADDGERAEKVRRLAK